MVEFEDLLSELVMHARADGAAELPSGVDENTNAARKAVMDYVEKLQRDDPNNPSWERRYKTLAIEYNRLVEAANRTVAAFTPSRGENNG